MTLRLNCVFLLPLVGKFAFETIIIDRSNIYNVEGLHFVKHSSILKQLIRSLETKKFFL